MHGKDITIPKGTELTAYVNGDFKFDAERFQRRSASGWDSKDTDQRNDGAGTW
jgi:hypothetical protein